MKDIDQIKKHLKPFDVLCFYKPDLLPLRESWFKRFLYWALSKPITWEANNFFGSKGDSKIFHVELYLGDDHNLVIEPPKLHWGDIDKVKYEKFSIFRLSTHEFLEEDRLDAIAMLEAKSTYYRDNGDEYSMKFIGSLYNLGDLGNFLVNQVTGSVLKQKYKPFSISRKDTVCSIGIATFFESFRRHLLHQNRHAYKKLFNQINIDTFRASKPRLLKDIEEDFAKHKSVSMEAVRPAFFGNSNFFENEFRLVKEFK